MSMTITSLRELCMNTFIPVWHRDFPEFNITEWPETKAYKEAQSLLAKRLREELPKMLEIPEGVEILGAYDDVLSEWKWIFAAYDPKLPDGRDGERLPELDLPKRENRFNRSFKDREPVY